jgi:hypothetical protein
MGSSTENRRSARPPGEYREFSGKLEGTSFGAVKGIRIVTKAHRFQGTKRWAPTIIFCVKDSKAGSSYCLNTYATSDGTRLVVIDEEEFFDHPLPGWLDEYWFSCSSIICSVELTSPPRTAP